MDGRQVAFAALLASLRHCGARKADHLPVKASDFDGRHLSRASLRWCIGGVTYVDPSPELLRTLQTGDYACISPATSKNDPFGMTFGDKPMGCLRFQRGQRELEGRERERTLRELHKQPALEVLRRTPARTACGQRPLATRGRPRRLLLSLSLSERH